jgi:hypothetical protein
MPSFTMTARHFDVIKAINACELSETELLALAKYQTSHSHLLFRGEES